jgi:hypothetical protein
LGAINNINGPTNDFEHSRARVLIITPV